MAQAAIVRIGATTALTTASTGTGQTQVALVPVYETSNAERTFADGVAALDKRDVPRRSPAVLGQRRRIDVGIEADGAGKFPCESARDVGAAPPRLRRVGDEAVSSGGFAELDGPERTDPDRCKAADRPAPPQKGASGRQGRTRVGGGEALLRKDFAAFVAHGNDELGAAGFDCTENTGDTTHGAGA